MTATAEQPALPASVERLWQASVIPELCEYIRIPNKSPHFDPDWQDRGFMDAAVDRFRRWAESSGVAGLQTEVLRLPERTPLLYIEVAGASEQTVLLYGHLDKQPEMSGWRPGTGPWIPHREGDRLYGRGGADDGYAMFASLTAIKLLQERRKPHARCVILIEACEESGSYDLPFYLDALEERIGRPALVVCLDSGCGNYEQLWCTTSLRGLLGGDLHVEILEEGVHSGDAGGVVPSSFRVLRELLDRLEDPRTGRILLPALHVEIPQRRIHEARVAAAVLGAGTYTRFPFHRGVAALSADPVELILNRTWRPALEITGAGGLPALNDAGNVLRPASSLKLSLRLPPRCTASAAAGAVKEVLEAAPPHGARVRFDASWCADGWDAPALPHWLESALTQASQRLFGRPAVYMGEGGTIPFMAMLGEQFPSAHFVVTGVLGPHANAHGPNEFLHIPTAMRLSCCIAEIIGAQYENAG